MADWDGKSKGTVLGYKIFVFCIKAFGVKAAYSVLVFVAMYYFLFLPKQNKAIYQYFRRLKMTPIKSFVNIYRSYFTFGQILIDKVAIGVGLRNQFTFEFDGVDKIKSVFEAQNGGVLISAHIGNFQIAEHFFNEIALDFKINLVKLQEESHPIKDYIDSITKEARSKAIYIQEDMSHIFEINAALARNELVCFTGDRFFEGNKTLSAPFLGETAHFPAGPFLIASRLKVPALFVYVMKEKNQHYHLYARVASVKYRDHQSLLQAYVEGLEYVLEKYPLQWFNYYDFWKTTSDNAQ